MTWWCAATGLPWRWEWQAYPGAWLLAGMLLVWWFRGRPRRGSALFLGGVVALWAATDWPLGPLGAGYLLSVHTVQFLLITLVAAPLLLAGAEVAGRVRLAGPVGRVVTHPLAGLGAYSVILTVTHLPPVVDTLMPTQFGSFAVDMLWLGGGLALYAPVVLQRPYSRMGPLLSVGYLFAATIVSAIPAALLTFSRLPIYAIYELAPRVTRLSAREDQQVAGLVMKVIGDPLVWVVMAIQFVRWQRAERAAG